MTADVGAAHLMLRARHDYLTESPSEAENKDSLPKPPSLGNSLAVLWLGLRAFTAEVPGFNPLVGELRSSKLQGAAKEKKTNVPVLMLAVLKVWSLDQQHQH